MVPKSNRLNTNPPTAFSARSTTHVSTIRNSCARRSASAVSIRLRTIAQVGRYGVMTRTVCWEDELSGNDSVAEDDREPGE